MRITADIHECLVEEFPGLNDIKGALYNVITDSRWYGEKATDEERLALTILMDRLEVEYGRFNKKTGGD